MNFLKKIFKRDVIEREAIKVLDIHENPDGSADVKIQMNKHYEKIVKKEAKSAGLSVEEFIVKTLQDFIKSNDSRRN